jgi:hypothetical protein
MFFIVPQLGPIRQEIDPPHMPRPRLPIFVGTIRV